MLTLLLLLLHLASQHPTCASTNTPIRLWPGKAPNETVAIGPETRRQDGTQSGCGESRDSPCDIILNVSTPTLTPYLVQHNGTGAAMVIAPGGGYHLLAIDKEGVDVARFYNSIGVSAFVLKYRVPARKDVPGLPKWWAALQDAQRAISLVRKGAKLGTWGTPIDASKIGFAGFSAGGHLTGHVSVTKQRIYSPVPGVADRDHTTSPRPDISIFGYPWYLLPNNTPPKWGEPYALSPEFEASIDFTHPRSLFIHNEDDPTAPVQGTLTYYTKLLSVNAPMSSLHLSPKGGHGFGLCQNGFDGMYEEICDWPKQVQRFLQVNDWAVGDPIVEQGKPPLLKDMLTQNCN